MLEGNGDRALLYTTAVLNREQNPSYTFTVSIVLSSLVDLCEGCRLIYRCGSTTIELQYKTRIEKSNFMMQVNICYNFVLGYKSQC